MKQRLRPCPHIRSCAPNKSKWKDTASPWGTCLGWKLLPGDKWSIWENGRCQSGRRLHYCSAADCLRWNGAFPGAFHVIIPALFSWEVEDTLLCFPQFKAKIPRESGGFQSWSIIPSNYGPCGLKTPEASILTLAGLSCPVSCRLSRVSPKDRGLSDLSCPSVQVCGSSPRTLA